MGDVIFLRFGAAGDEEPAEQTYEEIFTSPLGVTVVGVSTTFKDGRTEFSVYIENHDNPEFFDCVGNFEDSDEGRTLSKSAVSVATRTLEAMADLKKRAAQ